MAILAGAIKAVPLVGKDIATAGGEYPDGLKYIPAAAVKPARIINNEIFAFKPLDLRASVKNSSKCIFRFAIFYYLYVNACWGISY